MRAPLPHLAAGTAPAVTNFCESQLRHSHNPVHSNGPHTTAIHASNATDTMLAEGSKALAQEQIVAEIMGDYYMPPISTTATPCLPGIREAPVHLSVVVGQSTSPVALPEPLVACHNQADVNIQRAATQLPSSPQFPPAAKRTKVAKGVVAAWRCLCESANTEADEQPTSQCENSSTPALSTGSAIGIEMCESELSAATVESLTAGGTGIRCSLLALLVLLSRAISGFEQFGSSSHRHLGAALESVSIIQDEARVDSYDLSLLASACCFAGVLACWKLPPSLNSFFMSTNLKTDAPSLAAIRAKQIDWIVAFVIPLRQITIALMLVCSDDQSTLSSGVFMRALVAPAVVFLMMFFNPFNMSDEDAYRFRRCSQLVIVPSASIYYGWNNASFARWWPEILHHSNMNACVHTSLVPYLEEALWMLGWILAVGAPCPLWLLGIILVNGVLLWLKIRWLQRFGDEWASSHLHKGSYFPCKEL